MTHATQSRLGPGDLALYDSRYQLDSNALTNWSNMVLRLSEQFVRRWVRNPVVLSGRPLNDSQWGLGNHSQPANDNHLKTGQR